MTNFRGQLPPVVVKFFDVLALNFVKSIEEQAVDAKAQAGAK